MCNLFCHPAACSSYPHSSHTLSLSLSLSLSLYLSISLSLYLSLSLSFYLSLSISLYLSLCFLCVFSASVPVSSVHFLMSTIFALAECLIFINLSLIFAFLASSLLLLSLIFAFSASSLSFTSLCFASSVFA